MLVGWGEWREGTFFSMPQKRYYEPRVDSFFFIPFGTFFTLLGLSLFPLGLFSHFGIFLAPCGISFTPVGTSLPRLGQFSTPFGTFF